MKNLELKIPPVVVVLGSGGMMWAAGWALPSWRFGFPGRLPLAVGLGIVGTIIAWLGVVCFRRARTTVNPMKPESSSSLVQTGIYRVTRNPMYLGFLLWLVGWAVFLANAVGFVFLPLFVLYMNRFQIGPEERALNGIFGQEFEVYKRKVRRWL